MLFSDDHGGDRVAGGREHIAPLVERLLRRAQEQGTARADADATDIALINLMLGALVDATRDIDPVLWRRYLAIVLDGLRTSRAAPTPLPAAPLVLTEAEAALRCWRPSPPRTLTRPTTTDGPPKRAVGSCEGVEPRRAGR